MRGELIEVWGDTWREIWSPLLKNDEYEDDFLMDFYRMLVPLPDPPAEPDPMTLAYDDAGVMTPESQAAVEAYEAEREAFAALRAEHEEFATGTRDLRAEINEFIKTAIRTEADACRILRAVYKIINAIGDDDFTERYVSLVEKFLRKFSLRYDLRRPFHLCPTLPGMFSTLLREIKSVSQTDDHLSEIMDDFENAILDLNIEATPARIKSAIQKQVNLIEALGCQHPNATSNTVSRICNEVDSWPHDRLKESLRELYGFSCDYPGIRHAGTAANRRRDISLIDLISVSVLVSGFTPYLCERIDAERVYRATT